jgi:3-methylfumaryl-CoA hydratase
MMQTDLDSLKQWIGRTETLDDQATLVPLQALAATLDRDDPAPIPGDAVPACWHWLYFLPLQRASGIGPDGHPKRGGFLPPVPLPRRMWAGSRIVFERPLAAGESIRRASRIDDVSVKEGRTGTLVFVRVRHSIGGSGGPAITEEQDIVYRAMPQPGDMPQLAKAARTDEQFSRRIVPDPVLLFRYSALTFNGHRIHYDRPYATREEGYPGLVVHGPLIATLLLDLLRRSRPELRVRTFEFKAVSPLIDTAPFEVCGRLGDGTATLWARGLNGGLAMQASAAVEAT